MNRILISLFVVTYFCTSQILPQNITQDKSPVKSQSHTRVKDSSFGWELYFSFDISAATGSSGNAGAEFDGTYFYTTRWASNLIHKFDTDGNLIEEFSIPGISGLRDLAFDGTYMYGGTAGNLIYQMDFTAKTLVSTIPSPVTVRFIAYDEDNDAFWCGSWSDNPTLVSRTGSILSSFSTGLSSQYGAAYENVITGGPYLWIFDQGSGAGNPQIISQWFIPTGTVGGMSIDVADDFPGTNGIAGGLFTTTDLVNGELAIGGVLQGTPDMFFVYRFHWYIPGFFENFDGFIVGEQLACQDSLTWTTWSFDPCNLIEDPYISASQAWSGENSVVILPGNNLVKPLGGLNADDWYLTFDFYIPSGKAGYFGVLANFFDPSPIWGMECYFDIGGSGRLLNGSTINFVWQEDTWQQVLIHFDLDQDLAEMQIGTGNPLIPVAAWQWSRGGLIPVVLDAVNFFGPAPANEMYLDDFYFGHEPSIIPVELTSFYAKVNDVTVVLYWQTATEINNKGFEIQRTAQNEIESWKRIGFVEGSGTTTERRQYSFRDNPDPGNYKYRLKQIDFDGSFEYSDEVLVTNLIPAKFALDQNYPNPFNPLTIIKYSIPDVASGFSLSNITLKVYDILGCEIATLVNEPKPAGNYEVEFDASGLSSGVYFYRLESGEFNQVRKLILLK